MGHVIKISRKTRPGEVQKALHKLASGKRKKRQRSLADFYGAAPDIYEDGLSYQKKQRDDWQ